MSGQKPRPLSAFDDEPVVRYRPVSLWAVLGAVGGAMSWLALVDPLLWLVPPLAAAVCIAALRQTRHDPDLRVGRLLAMLGLLAALFFAAAAPADWWLYQRLVDREAQTFAGLWFRLLRENDPGRAMLLTEPVRGRPPLDEPPWDYYRRNERQFGNLESYVQQDLVRTLLALGPKADVRYYQSLPLDEGLQGDVVGQYYAVTYPAAAGKTTFFVLVRMQRQRMPREEGDRRHLGYTGWRLLETRGGVKPEE